MDPEDARREANARLLRERLDEELLAGRDFVAVRVGSLFSGFLGRVVNPLARGLYHAIGEAEVRRRAQHQLDLVLGAAEDARTRGVDAAVEAWADRILETEEIVHRGNAGHPHFPDVRRLIVEMLGERIELALGFLERGAGDGFEAAVRAAFPAREPLEEAMARQFSHARRIVRLVESEPDLLHFPHALQRPLFALVHDTLAWYEARLKGQFGDIYASA